MIVVVTAKRMNSTLMFVRQFDDYIGWRTIEGVSTIMSFDVYDDETFEVDYPNIPKPKDGCMTTYVVKKNGQLEVL